MKAGLEVHQQLATGKLFCQCPAELSEEVTGTFARTLRAASGENLQVDAAAAFQAARHRLFRYEVTPSNCLVDADEEPPHALNAEALEVAMTVALLLHAHPLDEVEVMRKIVIDGSNTTGFQRTALVAVDGYVDLHGKRYSIPSVCLEEDAARKSRDSDTEVVYRLDRLGIPLIEIATGPEITNPTEARELAEEIGGLLRATRRVRRGIGTIREDLNVSIEGGRRIEIKGVQELRLIHRYVESEVERQQVLLRVRDELKKRDAPAPVNDPVDLTSFFREHGSGFLAETARKSGTVLGLRLTGFAGLLQSPPGSEERLGRELADHARTAGLKGLIHSDELPGYGISAEECDRLREALHVGPGDGFVLVADRSSTRLRNALDRVARRATAALEGIPEETRDPLPDGRTRYSRPLPGRDRMYPETDISPIPIDPRWVEQLRQRLPERPEQLQERLAEAYSLPADVIRQVEGAAELERFEALVGMGHAPSIVARLLIQDLPSIAADGLTVAPSNALLSDVLKAQERGEFAKEGIPRVVTELLRGADSIGAAIERAGFSALSTSELDRVVDQIVAANRDVIQERGEAALSPLMGDVMKVVRGRRDGKDVADALRRSIDRMQHPSR
ncbi:MAG: Glu-tRNA(Gln) amidotransferase subunit GatE [Thermoplasmata archaeon]